MEYWKVGFGQAQDDQNPIISDNVIPFLHYSIIPFFQCSLLYHFLNIVVPAPFKSWTACLTLSAMEASAKPRYSRGS